MNGLLTIDGESMEFWHGVADMPYYFREDDGNAGWVHKKDKEMFAIELSVRNDRVFIVGDASAVPIVIESGYGEYRFHGYLMSSLPEKLWPPNVTNDDTPRLHNEPSVRLRVVSSGEVTYTLLDTAPPPSQD